MIAVLRRHHLRRGRREAARARRQSTAWRRPSSGSTRGPGPGLPAGRFVEQVWKVLEAFASFGFCKAHAAAFALPTYQSAWLKTHWPAHFLAGVLTHDPGMYPKRLILDDARRLGIAVLGLDVNAQRQGVRRGAVPPEVEEARQRRHEPPALPTSLRHPALAGGGQGHHRGRGRPDRRRPPLRLAHRLLAPRPGLPADLERLVLAGGVRPGLRPRHPRRALTPRPGHPPRPAAPGRRARAVRQGGRQGRPRPRAGLAPGRPEAQTAGHQPGRRPRRRRRAPQQHRPAGPRPGADAHRGARTPSARPSRACGPRPPPSRRRPDAAPVESVQLALDLGDGPGEGPGAGQRPARDERRGAMEAELEILGLDVSRHVVDAYAPSSTRSASPAAATCCRGGARRAAGRRGQGRHPDPADPHPAAGSSSSPSTTPPDRSTPPSSRTPRVPTPRPSSAPGCWSCAASCAVPATAASPCAPPAPGSSPTCTASGGARASRPSSTGSPPHPAPAAATPSSRRPGECWCTPAGSRCLPTPTSSPPATITKNVARKLWHRSPGSPG